MQQRLTPSRVSFVYLLALCSLSLCLSLVLAMGVHADAAASITLSTGEVLLLEDHFERPSPVTGYRTVEYEQQTVDAGGCDRYVFRPRADTRSLRIRIEGAPELQEPRYRLELYRAGRITAAFESDTLYWDVRFPVEDIDSVAVIVGAVERGGAYDLTLNPEGIEIVYVEHTGFTKFKATKVTMHVAVSGTEGHSMACEFWVETDEPDRWEDLPWKQEYLAPGEFDVDLILTPIQTLFLARLEFHARSGIGPEDEYTQKVVVDGSWGDLTEEQLQDLAERFLPILKMDATEEPEVFLPEDVSIFLEDEPIEGDVCIRREVLGSDVVVVPHPTLSDLSRYASCDFYIDLPRDVRWIFGASGYKEDYAAIRTEASTGPVAYATVLYDEESNTYALQYWFFFYFNDFADIHEGDWESIAIILGNDFQPLKVGYSAHAGRCPLEAWTEVGGGYQLDWDWVEKLGDHPVVYVGNGGHASYFYRGSTRIFCKTREWFGFAEHHNGDGIWILPEGVSREEAHVPAGKPDSEILRWDEIEILPRLCSIDEEAPTSWLVFSGSWGQRPHVLRTQHGTVVGQTTVEVLPCNGPDGPPFNTDGKKWLKPFEWVNGLPTGWATEQDAVAEAIRRGAEWLYNNRLEARDGIYWTYSGQPSTGVTALCILALLQAGYDADDPVIQGAVDYILAHRDTEGCISVWKSGGQSQGATYETSMSLLALLAADYGRPEVNAVADSAVGYLVSSQNPDGGWRYWKDYWHESSVKESDISVTQWAVFALHKADYRRKDLWDNVETFVLNRQRSDGRFTYRAGNPNRGGTMTSAGVWCLLMDPYITRDENDERWQAVEKAFDWLEQCWTVNSNLLECEEPVWDFYYYYVYSLAKACALYGKKTIDKHDWYDEISSVLLALQDQDGSWIRYGLNSNPYYLEAPYFSTALALLTLEIGKVPENVSARFVLRSNAELTIGDPRGNYASRESVEIPYARFEVEPDGRQVVEIDSLTSVGAYTYILKGTGSGVVHLSVEIYQDGEIVDSAVVSTDIKAGLTKGGRAVITSIEGHLSAYVDSPSVYPTVYLEPAEINLVWESGQELDSSFVLSETGGTRAIKDVDIFASNLETETGAVIPSNMIGIIPDHIDSIPAHSDTTVRFSISVPEGAYSGDYEGKILVETGNAGMYSLVIRLTQFQPAEKLSAYAYPNPFNPDEGAATFKFEVPEPTTTTIDIYDVSNTLVTNLISDLAVMPGDEPMITWDGTNAKGRIVANGVYFYVIKASNGEEFIGKIAVLR